MRVLHLATFLHGGTGRVITDLAIEQRRAGHDVRVLASATGAVGYGNYQAYIDELTAAGVPVRLVDSLFHRKHAANLPVVKALLEWYAQGREPQVIHSHAAVPALVGLLFMGARRTGAVQVQTMHGWGTVNSGDQVATDVAVLNLMDRVAAPSRHAVDTLVSLGVAPARMSLVPYGVRPEGASLADRDAELLVDMTRARRQGALVVACVGTIGTRKNQFLLIEALALLRNLPVLCVFIGDGETEALRAAAINAGVEHRVRVHGYSGAARRLAASAELLVLPSRSEGQPVSVLEAFCDGTLVAVSDIPELAELVGEETGFRFTPGDASALAETLATVAGLPNSTRRTIRQHARSQYQARFTVEAMAREYLALYESADKRGTEEAGPRSEPRRSSHGGRQPSVA
jgi:glycosyltransferase involved in cell wall biosynthesis